MTFRRSPEVKEGQGHIYLFLAPLALPLGTPVINQQ